MTGVLRDVSIILGTGTPEWPDDTPYSCGWTWAIANGASVNVSAYTASPHVGTHADAPLHVRDGWIASHELPLDAFVGPAQVCGVVAGRAALGVRDLTGLPPGGRIERLIVRTGHTIARGTFPAWWPALTPEAVDELVGRGLRLLALDAPSVDARESTALEVHVALFSAGAFNLENLDLRGVPDGAYELLALPLRIEGLDAAPARAVLRAP
ncbi:MAG: cyclase family protein [Gemmatimonadaceae bacterium]